MFTHSECEISQSWRTLFSSHGAFNLNRADMPLLPLSTLLKPILFADDTNLFYSGKDIDELYSVVSI